MPDSAPAGAGRLRTRLPPATTLLAGLACAAGGAASAGSPGLLAGLLAAVVVTGFFWSGLVPLFLARDGEAAGLALVVLLVNYALRLVVALVLLAAATAAGAADSSVLGVSVIVCALTWGATQAALLRR